MKILFKYPTRGRPQWFKSTLDKYYGSIRGDFGYEFLITLDSNDPSMNNPEMCQYLSKKKNLRYCFGDSKTKVQAVNADMGKVLDWDVLFLISDDMIPVVRDLDIRIVSDMRTYFPKLDGALHYNDGAFGKDNTITLSILGRALYNHFGFIYNPVYKSFYCDNEFTDEVRKIKRVVYIPEIVVKHEWKGHAYDKTYAVNKLAEKEDEALYLKRKFGPKFNGRFSNV